MLKTFTIVILYGGGDFMYVTSKSLIFDFLYFCRININDVIRYGKV